MSDSKGPNGAPAPMAPPASPLPRGEDGFVFSNAEIETFLRREERGHQAYIHYLHAPA